MPAAAADEQYLRVFSLVGVHDHDCGEGDVQLLRGLFVQHGYDPGRHPHVCQLDGVPVDSCDDPERTGSLIRCGKKNLNLPNLSSIIGAAGNMPTETETHRSPSNGISAMVRSELITRSLADRALPGDLCRAQHRITSLRYRQTLPWRWQFLAANVL
jgi:hypothetical protein